MALVLVGCGKCALVETWLVVSDAADKVEGVQI